LSSFGADSEFDTPSFFEPLGYIGINSNFKTLDFPGLSSPEMIAARRRASPHSYPVSVAPGALLTDL
jgi:hypothetical protein